MPKFQVERSINIDAPKEKILKSLANYKEWEAWSPWLLMDEDVQVTYKGEDGTVGSAYTWDGHYVGSGGMELRKIQENTLEMKLDFFKPFKSKADIFWELENKGSSTKVTWKMHSSLPFFLFFMVKQMKVWIGMDYERGLRMLKEYMETESVSSQVTVDGIQKKDAIQYIGIKRESSFKELGEIMKKDYESLFAFIAEHNIEPKGVPFSIYNTFKMNKRTSEFVSCIPYEGHVALPEEWVQDILPSCEVFQVTHKGAYEHVGNAWSTAITHTRIDKIKIKKKPMGYEFYLNDPHTTEKKDLLTEVCLALR